MDEIKLVVKSIPFHPEAHRDLLAKIDDQDLPFAKLGRLALQFYFDNKDNPTKEDFRQMIRDEIAKIDIQPKQEEHIAQTSDTEIDDDVLSF